MRVQELSIHKVQRNRAIPGTSGTHHIIASIYTDCQRQRYEVRVDDYHKIKRLNLYKHDGSPVMPLYIAYTTPKMLPTTTLNPLVTATATAKAKRGLPIDHEVFMRKSGNMADNVFWAGVLASGAGAVLWWFF